MFADNSLPYCIEIILFLMQVRFNANTTFLLDKFLLSMAKINPSNPGDPQTFVQYEFK